MAITDIQATVLRITGVTPTANSVEDAQRFVVSSVPKDLLKWAGTETSVGGHGGDSSPNTITLPYGTDNILSVRRGTYEAIEVTSSQRAFLEADNGSLKEPTTFHPKYFVTAGNEVRVKPNPTDIITAHVNFVDYAKIDDDSDLRNAVIYQTSAHEFTKIATNKTIDYIDKTVPVSPTLQDNSISFSTNVPTFIPPIMSIPDFSDTNYWISEEEDSEMVTSRIQEINAKVSEYSARMAEAQAVFNKENAEYQAQLQISVQDAKLSSQDDAQKIQDYSVKVQTYSGEVTEQIQKIDTVIKNMHYYSNESKRYYEWSRIEIQQYVQNNSKMIQAGIAMQSNSQQQQSRR